MFKARCLLLLLPAIASCGNDDGSGAPGFSSGGSPGNSFACHIGELTGTWRTSYSEKNGDCGPVPDETVSFDAANATGSGSACTVGASKISSDKCRLDFDYTCPTTDGKGSQHWTGVTHQIGDAELSSDMSVQVQHPSLGTCRSTYSATMKKL